MSDQITLTQIEILKEIEYLYTIMFCYKDEITTLEILDISGNYYHIIDIDYPRITYKYGTKIKTSKYFNNLMTGIEWIIKNNFPFTEFNINIRNKISKPDRLNRSSLIHFDKSPINFIDWNIIGSSMPNKYFATTKFKYRRKAPNALSVLSYKYLQL
jgi:hypothetical protein